MDKICRICLKVCSQPIDRISNTLKISYFEIYRYVSGVEPSDEPKYLCLVCTRKLSSVYSFKKKIDENETEFRLKIAKDSKSVDERGNKDVPLKSKGNPKRKHESACQQTICGYCGRLFNEKTIKQHIKNVHHKSSTSFFCDLCHSTLTTKAGLSSHMKIKHLSVTFPCRYCSESYPNRSVRRTHELRFHTFDLRFSCTYCSKKFPDNAQLKRHTSTHTGERKHICVICGMAFITKNKLKLHYASHSNARPFPCLSCTAAFKTRNNLRQHAQTHGNRNYECPVCHFAYLTNQQMRKHVKKVHPEYDELPPPGTVLNKGALSKISAITEKYHVNVSPNICITRKISK